MILSIIFLKFYAQSSLKIKSISNLTKKSQCLNSNNEKQRRYVDGKKKIQRNIFQKWLTI